MWTTGFDNGPFVRFCRRANGPLVPVLSGQALKPRVFFAALP
nr:hypothetical protein [Kibdelosporangium sp. MJ126-NF4]